MGIPALYTLGQPFKACTFGDTSSKRVVEAVLIMKSLSDRDFLNSVW